MPSTPKEWRFVWLTAVALCVLGLLGWLWICEIWEQYAQYLPRSPRPVTGNIYPLGIHGSVVYLTSQEQRRLDKWDFWSTAIFCSGMALGGVYQWRSRRRVAKSE